MTTPSPTLPPLEPDVAKGALQEIELAYTTAYADAALHDPTERPLKAASEAKVDERLSHPKAMRQAVTDGYDFISSEFEGSEREALLKAAFDNLLSLVHARSIVNPKPGEQAYLVQACLETMAADRQKIADGIAQGTLPGDCMGTFSSACGIATIQRPKQKWLIAAADRKGQEGGMNL